ncbi:TIGR01906 family membrane protein [Faecalimonas sp.]
MRIIHRIVACLTVVSTIIVLLIASAELAIYVDFRFYEKEYEKYQVLDDLEMKMEDVMFVTYEMMDYLHGKRTDLIVSTTVDGEEREFFNNREKQHMEDVQNIFLGGIKLRNIASIIMIVGVIILIYSRAKWKMLLAKWYMGITSIMIIAGVGIGYIFSKDFSKYFVKFHEIFFDNDLWLLDPDTDLMIRMLPEGFFVDFSVRIGIFVTIALVVNFIASFCIYRSQRNKISETY